jgi:mono/diheme cytochrome c family protein
MGGLPGLLGTRYGHVALIKLGLFIGLLSLAVLNRLVLTERLAHGHSRTHMRLSIAVEMSLGLLVIVVAGSLASLTPGTHEQPVWPFGWRLNLSAFAEPLLRRELVGALIAVAAGVVVGVVGMIGRRSRWYALPTACFVVFLAFPHLRLLFVEAYPTSFFTSPTEFAATGIAHGARLFAANCVACHGAEGRGDGPLAKSLPAQPADLTAQHFWAHSDGDLYWFISRGFKAPDGNVAMPGFGGALSSDAIWHLIDYLRAYNAGEDVRRSGTWLHPLPVPQFDAACSDGRMIDLDDLRGRVLHIIASSGDERGLAASPVGADVTTIIAVRHARVAANSSVCITREPEAWTALAIILGLTPDTLASAQILADGNAWLRAAWRPGEPGDWTDPRELAARIRDIAAQPLAVTTPGAHVHGQ